MALSLSILSSRPSPAQEEVRPLRLEGITLNGPHPALTENWVTIEVTVGNVSAMGRDGRVVVFYADQPDVQYARDLWIPPRSSLRTWMLVGPAPPSPPLSAFARAEPKGVPARELQALIYDRTGHQERLLMPRSEERVRSRSTAYRAREPLTCLLADDVRSDQEPEPYPPPPPQVEKDEVLDLLRAFRAASELSEKIQVINDFLPPIAATFDGVDHVVLAGQRLDLDSPGQVVLRRWLEQGGKLWVMLDRTDPDLVARILGGEAGFHVVDRTTLSSVRIEGRGSDQLDAEDATREFDQPLDFVRVKVTSDFTVVHTVNGWPASFIRPVGQGSVLITTLGARGWVRPRIRTDGKSPYSEFPDIPVLMPFTDVLAQELQPPSRDPSAPSSLSFPNSSLGTSEWNALTPLVTGDIGYSVVGVGTASLMFGGFLLVLLLVGVGLRRSRRSELLGWLGPVAALITAVAFLAVGEASRRAVPPTVAVAEMVAVNPRTSEQAVTGLLGLYRPSSGPTALSSTQGGLLELDMSGLEGQTRRLVVTDIDAWHWENLALPTGVRQGPFRSEVRKTGSMAAVARFGSEGLEGKVSGGPFQNLSDAVIYAPSRRAFAVRLRPDGSFTAGDNDLLSPGQFVAGTVLSDQQQRRQLIYRHFLAETKANRRLENSLLLAWADPVPVPFILDSDIRATGSAFLSFPLQLEHSPPDTPVKIPRGFIPYRRIMPLGATQPTMEALYAVEEHLRFQVPPCLLPLRVEEARLFARVEAPTRRFKVSRETKDGSVEFLNALNPIDPLVIDIQQPEMLRLDEQGGFHLDIAVSDPEVVVEGPLPKWTIPSLELEIIGRTQGKIENRK